MKETIENVRVFDATGEDVTPDKLKRIQENKKLALTKKSIKTPDIPLFVVTIYHSIFL